MRRSFGGGTNMGGGGGIMRTVQRAVRAGGAPPDPFSPSVNATTAVASAHSRRAKKLKHKQPTSPNTASGLSNGASSFSSLVNLPVSAASGSAAPSWVPSSDSLDETEWECVDGSENERARAFYEDCVFGTVPSRDEVQHAVSALQQVLASSSSMRSPNLKLVKVKDKDEADDVANPIGFEERLSSAESLSDWVEPSLNLCQRFGSDRVYDAFHLLETEPSVQRMVVSLSSDKAVWDAVLNNEVVKELRGSFSQKADDGLAEESPDEGSDDSDPINDFLSWIITNGKARIMQLIDSVIRLMNEAFRPPNVDSSDDFQDKLKQSLLLSVVVLVIVVITRANTA